MTQIIRLYGLFLAVLALTLAGLTGCEKHKAKTEAPPTAPPEAATPTTESSKATKPLVVMGLYIGMPVQELANVAQSRFKGWHFAEASHHSYWLDRANGAYWEILVECDDSGKVTQISFDKDLSTDLFNAGNLSAYQFAKAFSEAYSIPPMNSRNSFYESEVLANSVVVRITDKKQVIMGQVDNPDALKPHFN
jgi:hypothetical protein